MIQSYFIKIGSQTFTEKVNMSKTKKLFTYPTPKFKNLYYLKQS